VTVSSRGVALSTSTTNIATPTVLDDVNVNGSTVFMLMYEIGKDKKMHPYRIDFIFFDR